MSEDDQRIAESIRSGKYFAEARSWFQTIYIGPISERSFFLIVAILASLITVFALSAVFSLLPLMPKTPILVLSGDRPDEIQPSLVQIDKGKQDNNPSLSKFFVLRYVQAREGYMYQTFAQNALFIRSQSNEATYGVYSGGYNPVNPESPFAPLGELGRRIVTLKTVRNNFSGDSGTAEVEFFTETTGVENPVKSQWIAKMEYLYKPLVTATVKNEETGKKELSVSDPQFQVTSYVLEQK